MVRAAWIGQEVSLKGAISDFILKAQKWNKDVFGNIFVRKK